MYIDSISGESESGSALSATIPNRGTEPARVKRGNTRGETTGAAKLDGSRHTATLIVPLFPTAPRILSPVWLC
jgi:hypothetical protein